MNSISGNFGNYYSEEELKKIGFIRVGKDVFISRKANIYGANKMSLGNNIRIDDNVILAGKIEFGSHIHIGAMSYISAGDDGIFFEDITGVSPFVYITTTSDDYSGKSMFSPVIPERYKKENHGQIIIRKYSIIGAHSMIMPGVELREGTSVGAMSFVRKSSKAWSIYFGCPAKQIGVREKDIVKLSEEFLLEYNIYNTPPPPQATQQLVVQKLCLNSYYIYTTLSIWLELSPIRYRQ
jgi:acetyltransferase-like isoleucine patch superfamily enzyme